MISMTLSDEEAAAIAIMAREWGLSLQTAFDKWPGLPEDHKAAFRDAAKRAVDVQRSPRSHPDLDGGYVAHEKRGQD